MAGESLFEIEWTITPPDLFRRLARLDPTIIEDALNAMRLRVIASAKRYATDGPLHVRTGRLRAGLYATVTKTGGGDWELHAGSTADYWPALERGATYPARTVRPRDPQGVLRFVTKGGDVVFSRYANIPAYTTQPKPVVEPAMREAWPQLVADVREGYRKAVFGG